MNRSLKRALSLSLAAALLTLNGQPAAAAAAPAAVPAAPVSPAPAVMPAAAVSAPLTATTSSTGLRLSPVALEIAQELGLVPTIERLAQLKSLPQEDLQVRLEHVTLKEQLTETVLVASLQVRDMTARIDHESVQMLRVHQLIQDRADRGVRLNTLANVIGGGSVNELGQALELMKNEIPGEVVELAAGALTLGLSSAAIRQQSGGSRRIASHPGLLAKAFEFPVDSESDYPSIIWSYLNHPPIGDSSGRTRLQLLRTYWLKNSFSPDIRTAQGKRRAAVLAGIGTENRVNLSALEDRTALLGDLRAEVLQVDRALLELLLCTRGL